MRVASLAKSAHALLPYSAAPHGSAKRGSPHRAERTTPSVSENGMVACSSASCGTWALMFLSIICAASRCASGESDVTPVSNNRLHCSASASMESCDCLSRLSRIRESRLRSSASSPSLGGCDAANRIDLYAASTARRDTRRVERFRRSPPIRDENTEQISFPSRHDRQSDHADRTTPGHFHPNMTWCGTRRNNGERRRMTKRCKMAVPINQRWPHQRMLRKTSHCVAEPLPHNADLGHFRAGVAMRSSFRSQRDNTRAQ